MKSILLISICILLSNSLLAQKGNVEIIKDNRIDELVKQQGEIIPPANEPQISGYRLQIFFDTDKNLVDNARTKFLAQYPNTDTYVAFKAPNYFLKVGNFRTKLEAEKIKSMVEKDFPTCFVTSEMISLPRID